MKIQKSQMKSPVLNPSPRSLAFTCVFILAFAFMGSVAAAASIRGVQFKSGDIIFQTSLSNQANAIILATGSPLSHVGVVEVDKAGQVWVLEAIKKVSRTSLQEWIARGKQQKFELYRARSMTVAAAEMAIRKVKEQLLNTPYDIFFTSYNSEIYCSELVDMAFAGTGLSFGKYQKVRELNLNNQKVRQLVRQRWQQHPLCRNDRSFDACWSKILEDQLITPASIALDGRLSKIYSNYY